MGSRWSLTLVCRCFRSCLDLLCGFVNPYGFCWFILIYFSLSFHSWTIQVIYNSIFPLAFLYFQLYEINDDPKRKVFLDDLFAFMQKRGECGLRNLFLNNFFLGEVLNRSVNYYLQVIKRNIFCNGYAGQLRTKQM